MASTRIASLVATTVFGLTAPLSGQVAPPSADPALPARPAAAERFNLGLRGVYFIENQGQWSDASVHYGLKSRGLDVAFRESSFTMHLARECASTSRAREEAGFAPSPGSAGEGRRGGELLHHTNYEFNLSLEREALLPHGRGSSGEPAEYEHLTLTVTFPGSNPVAPRGAQPQAAKFNYFVGGEGRGTASNVPSFGAVVYENLYSGIDLLVTGNDDGVMKYEFHCAPGADYSQIRIHYEGIDSLCVNDDGDLEIATSFGTLLDGAPIVWQEGVNSLPRLRGGGPGRGSSDLVEMPIRASAQGSIHPHPDPPPQSRGREQSAAARQTIPARFELVDAATYRIALDAAPDPSLPLVIDPEVEWMYYLGGSGRDFANCVDSDETGGIMVAGITESADFEGARNTSHGGTDAFIAKLTDSGSLLWMTYLGGTLVDYATGVATSDGTHTYVAGETTSSNFVGQLNSHHGGATDAFALKVDSLGEVEWMVYLGGRSSDDARGIDLDAVGNALVAGSTQSTDFEGRNNGFHGRSDAYVAKVSPIGQIQWMTYLGGSGGDLGGDYGSGVAVDSAGSSYVTGWTFSLNFEGRINDPHGFFEVYDAFALKVSSAGRVQWMRYLGGGDWDYGWGIAVDQFGEVYITGDTRSAEFEGRNNAFHGGATDAFALRLSSSGALHWMTYLGGSSIESGNDIAVDRTGTSCVTGYTRSTDFEGRDNSFHGGGISGDCIVVRIDTSGVLEWMTYLGGSESEEGQDIAVDSDGQIVVAGSTVSTDFEGRSNSHHGSDFDAFLLKLRLADVPQLTVAPTCPSGGPIQIEWSGATPGGQVALIFARNTGSFIIPNNRPCAGTQLGLGSNQIQIVYNGHAGVNGSRTLNTTAGPGACGGYLQLLDLTTCGTSNVARVE